MSKKAKKVLIIGAGAAGLVAAKTLLQRSPGEFRVTIFEKECLGGMWHPDKNHRGHKSSPKMRTNLSKFTVGFSDLGWGSVLDENGNEFEPGMFPQAHMVGNYLRTYAKKFNLDGEDTIFSRKVLEAHYNKENLQPWTVNSVDNSTGVGYENTFHYLIIASGFFQYSKCSLIGLRDFTVRQECYGEFRDASSYRGHDGNVCIIGGGISGVEAAASAALQVSEVNTKDQTSRGKHETKWTEDNKVYHIVDRPFYVLPRYLPTNPYDPSIQDFRVAPSFAPLDLVLYNLSRRGEGPISASVGVVPPAKAKKGHEFLRSVLGTDQRDLGRSELVYKPGELEYPAYTAISDTYASFVRSGLIVPVRGRAERIVEYEFSDEHEICQDRLPDQVATKAKIEVSHKSAWSVATGQATDEISVLENVVSVVEATGFKADVDFLDEAVKEALEYDPNCKRIPFLVSKGAIFNPNVPELAFVGFYEGPYWGVMEMQAHIIAQNWCSQYPEAAEVHAAITQTLLSTAEAANTRQAIKEGDMHVPQFWMSDYVGLVEELSRVARVPRLDGPFFEPQSGPVVPARYLQDPDKCNSSTFATFTELKTVCQMPNVAPATFIALAGPWKLRRKIISRHPSSPGGHFVGTAHFHPRMPTDSVIDPETRRPTDSAFLAEYLYIEKGTFTMDNGYVFEASRRYVYRFRERREMEGEISVWFVEENGFTVECLFIQLEFQPHMEINEDGTRNEKGWIAKSRHFCEPDQYTAECEFRFRGAGLDRFGIGYGVLGPEKDYGIDGWYER